MRRFVAGHLLAWMAVAVLIFAAPCFAQADLILPGSTATEEAPASPDTPEDVPGRVGFAITADEFIGGLIMSVIAIGGAVYLGLKAGDNDL